MSRQIDRRMFLGRSLCLGGAAVALRSPRLGARPASAGSTPIIITSHRNETGREGLRAAWEILSSGGSALDAVEKATNVIEVDPEDASVGYGGLPNEDGVIQLDASIM
ncbi:MAG: isoaspartyl peptidase/L-asparaginase, partial [Gemmatimonadota bacterium]